MGREELDLIHSDKVVFPIPGPHPVDKTPLAVKADLKIHLIYLNKFLGQLDLAVFKEDLFIR